MMALHLVVQMVVQMEMKTVELTVALLGLKKVGWKVVKMVVCLVVSLVGPLGVMMVDK